MIRNANAVDYARKLLKEFDGQVSFRQANVLKWQLDAMYEIVWSSGLFDYLSDALFVRTLRRLVSACAMSGEVIIENFSPENANRAYMEFDGWHLIHRDEDQLRGLAKRAGVDDGRIHIGSEVSWVNLFLHVRG